MNKKVPCIAAMKGTSLRVSKCNLKGDLTNEAVTTGVLGIEPNYIKVEKCVMTNHKSGAVIMDLDSESKVKILENQIYDCHTAGIYIQGEDS